MPKRKVHDHIREYISWHGARYRCTSEKHPAWQHYGGRGITMCDRWKESFWNFLEDMGPRPDGLELDRIDNDGNYEPGNCRWITPSENNRNKYRAIPLPKSKGKKAITGREKAKVKKLGKIEKRYQERLIRWKARIAAIEAEIRELQEPVRQQIREEHRPDA